LKILIFKVCNLRSKDFQILDPTLFTSYPTIHFSLY
jgi:hypothetical protein